jgi:hypothetical protein
MACKGSSSASRPRIDQRPREDDPQGENRPCRARPADSGPGREGPERRRRPRPEGITKTICELSTGWSVRRRVRIPAMSSLITTLAHVHIQIAGPWPSVAIASLALMFTVGSFWLLNARQGRLKSSEPQSFAACRTPDKLRLLFPLVIYNSGATPIIVQDMQLNFPEESRWKAPIPWTTTRSQLPPSDDGWTFPAVFSIPGRSAQQMFIELGAALLRGGHPAGMTPLA